MRASSRNSAPEAPRGADRFPRPASVAEALRDQERFRRRVRLAPFALRRVLRVAGVDVSHDLGSDRLYAGVVVVSFPRLETIEARWAASRARFPYVPGLLAFREVPALLEAWRLLESVPDVIVCDGHGIAHPRRCGFASTLGVVLHTPAVGCAKSVLVGRYREPGRRRGARSWLTDGGERIGVALRSRAGVKPLFVSPGHRIDFAGAVRLVLATTRGYRLPEPTRRAHQLANWARRGGKGPPWGGRTESAPPPGVC